MKKSTWLSLATAAAIVTTSAGTFATWDSLTDTKTVEVTYVEGVKVKTTIASTASGGVTIGDTIATGKKKTVEIPFDVEISGKVPTTHDTLEFSATGLQSGANITFKKNNAEMLN